MKEALVSPNLTVQIVDSPIPLPGPGEVLIKVKCAGCNPKDWKYPVYSGTTANSGDDVAGEISSVGEGRRSSRRHASDAYYWRQFRGICNYARRDNFSFAGACFF